MTPEEFEKLNVEYDENGPFGWRGTSMFVEYTSPRSKYSGSILEIRHIYQDWIRATCSISGAPRINPESHYKNFELTTEKEQKYFDAKLGSETVKDFFNDDINVGDYVFGEWDRCLIFGVVRSTKKAEATTRKYGSKALIHDSGMVEIIKSTPRNGGYEVPIGSKKLLAMQYFIKIEDPTLYLLKL